MESKTLFYSLDLVSGNGLTLSSEQKAALQTSLVILRNYLQILGIQGDYFIAQGVSDDEMSHKNSLFIFNCVDWHRLPPAALRQCERRFLLQQWETPHISMSTQRQGEGGEAMEEDVMVRRSIKVNEENRLPTTVHTIDKQVSVVLRGTSIKSPHGLWCLSSSEMDKLRCFLHFTEPKNLKKNSILDLDIPKGNRQFEHSSTVCDQQHAVAGPDHL
uniref:Radial spoke head protein 9 homolog n=1 Tax=Oncorhynchus tshawytscha TaxID=74940 RepID=A0A8C8M278_ONCTS